VKFHKEKAMTNFAPTPRPHHSPWGPVQDATQLFPGVWRVHTASHGGLMLSDARFAAMPAPLQCNIYGRGTCFEEDSEWTLVAAAFLDEFRSYLPAGQDPVAYIAWHLQTGSYEQACNWWLEHLQTTSVPHVEGTLA
jgi:hypothetical protein